jgi:hypothetical protein
MKKLVKVEETNCVSKDHIKWKEVISAYPNPYVCMVKNSDYFLHLETFYSIAALKTVIIFIYHHHQPINFPTAGAQVVLMDDTKGERAIIHHGGPVRVGG